MKTSANRIFHVATSDEAVPTFDSKMDDYGQATNREPGDIFYAHDFVLDEEQTTRFRSGEIKVFIYSITAYSDIYHQDVERTSEVTLIAEHFGGTKQGDDGIIRETLPLCR